MSDLASLFQTLKSSSVLTTIFAPIIINRAYVFFMTKRRSSKPLQAQMGIAILGLFMTAITQYIYLQWFRSRTPNVVLETGSRLKTPGNVIGSRYAALHPNDADANSLLFERLSSESGRLLYALFGPALGDCDWCVPESRYSYVTYILPEVVLPYVVNSAVSLVATSYWMKEASQWRSIFLIALSCVALFDIGGFLTYNVFANSALPANQVKWYYWSKFTFRANSLVFFNLGAAVVLFLTGTGRLGSYQEPIEQRLLTANQKLDLAMGKFKTVSILRSSVAEDKDSRENYDRYWAQTRSEQSKLFAQPTVKEAVRNARERVATKQRRRDNQQFINTFA